MFNFKDIDVFLYRSWPTYFFPKIKCTSFILILRVPYYGEAAKIYHLKFWTCVELNAFDSYSTKFNEIE